MCITVTFVVVVAAAAAVAADTRPRMINIKEFEPQ